MDKNKERDENVLSLFKKGKTCSDIVKELKMCKLTVKKVLLNFGINYTEELLKEKDWKLKQIPILYSQGKSQIDLERELNLTRKTIREVLKKSNVKYRSDSEAKTLSNGHYINHNAFDDLTDPETLYWIGFIYTDGHVTIDNNKGQNCIQIKLQEQDKDHLEKFKSFLKCNYEIKHRLENNKYPAVQLKVFSKKLCSVLKSLGFTENKTYTLIPHEKLKNSRDFWRGCVDGDGCLSFDNYYSQWIINLVGTKETCGGLADFIVENSIYNKRNVNKDKNSNLHKIVYSHLNCKQVSELLYKNAVVFLDRKYQKYLEIQEYYK